MSGTRPAEILRQLEQADRAATGDAALLERFARSRDQAAFALLVRRHGPMVLSVCRRITTHAQDAEDAFQAVFLVLARKGSTVRNPGLLGNWLYGVAVRVARKARWAAGRRRVREVQAVDVPDPFAPDADGVVADIGPLLHEELARLPTYYRDAIVLCDLRGVSRADAAKALGVPEGTLSSRLANGRKRLADRLTRRGVTLAVAVVPAVLADGRAAVPDSLVSKTCGLVADWAAGGVVPAPVLRLAHGAFPMRTTLLVGVLTVTFSVGIVSASRLDDPLQPADHTQPRGVTAVVPATQPVAVADPNADEKPAGFTTSPRLSRSFDLSATQIHSVSWSPDGGRLVVWATVASFLKDSRETPGIYTLTPKESEAGFDQQLLQMPRGLTLVGLTPDGKQLVTARREYDLISGKHELEFQPQQRPDVGSGGRQELWPVRKIDLGLEPTERYAFAPDGKTFRTVRRDLVPPPPGEYTGLAVWEVSADTGRRMKTLLEVEGRYRRFDLSADGRRLAVFDLGNAVSGYDVDAGTKKWTRAIEPRSESPRLGKDAIPALALSADGKRLAVGGWVGLPIVLNATTGEPLPPLDSAELLQATPDPNGFSAGGRLLALVGNRYARREIGNAPVFYEAVGPSVTVWDTDTGKVLKSWNGRATVAFHPTRPVLAVLEKNGDTRFRLGLWDFAAEMVEK